jgi:hypothetical protein
MTSTLCTLVSADDLAAEPSTISHVCRFVRDGKAFKRENCRNAPITTFKSEKAHAHSVSVSQIMICHVWGTVLEHP